MSYRVATLSDCSLLGALNHRLIQDERHRNRMTPSELEDRMRGWLQSDYEAILIEAEAGMIIGYALYRMDSDEVYLRQLYILPEHRRKGFGRQVIRHLKEKVWPKDKRLTVDVLITNESAIRFWQSMGYQHYAVTMEILPPPPLIEAPVK